MFFESTSVDRWCRTLLLSGFVSVTAAAAAPKLEFMEVPASREIHTEDGVVTLAWAELPEPWEAELQQAAAPGFDASVVRYRGRDDGSVLTGLAEGRHHFRVRAVHPNGAVGTWSEPVTVRVTFMDRGRLGWLLGIGGIVVVATAGAIIAGYVRHRDELDEEVTS